nr:putative disease resistance RPP13-like protein 1 [Ziziphus jujuba var. spinosa]
MSMPFKYGARGSKIIVTRHTKNIAEIMSTIPTHYQLKQLKDEDCWRLFKKHAFDNIKDDSSVRKVLETIGKQIIQKCNGLPLAAKILGGLLRCKEDVSEWERILKSDIWDFSQSDLILDGRNLLQQSKINKRMEDVGDEYFNELVSTSFFQRSSGQELFGMHDLVHDLAKYVSRGHCIILQDDSSKDAIANVHHASVRYLDSPMRYDSIITEATQLRTIFPLFPTSYRYLSNEVVNLVILNLRYLRVLSYHGCVTVKELSESIGELKHLRFLRLNHTRIERLPKSVSKLYNLQVLNLLGCSYLIELPENMHHLINLRYLDITGCRRMVEMPRQMSKLKSLQTLTDYIAGIDNATNIGELTELSDLHAQLCLQNLENVAKASDISDAKLVDKKYLEALHLDWKGDDKD